MIKTILIFFFFFIYFYIFSAVEILYNYFDNATFGAVMPDDRFIEIQSKDYISGAYFSYRRL